MAQTFTSTEVTTGTNVFGDNQSQRVNENTLRSNFSGSSQPSDPVVGQHWYDTGNNREMTYNGTSWVAVDTNTATQVDVKNSAGNLSNLKSFLSVAHNDDGTLKVTPTSSIDEFKENSIVVTYVNPTTFTTPNDLTGIFTQYRKVKVYLSASTAISSVSSSSYNGTSNVTTVVLSTSAMDATLVNIRYSIVQYGFPDGGTFNADITAHSFNGTLHGTADNANKLGGYPVNTNPGGTWGSIPFITLSDGVMEVGKYLDWHATNGGNADYTARFTAEDNGTVTVGTINGTLNGTAGVSNTVIGSYNHTNNGKFAPDHFGRNRVGFLMSDDLGGNYKNWLIMDNYDANDVGGATAIGLDRTAIRAYIMRSNADRQSWVENAELITSAIIGSQSVAHAGTADNASTLNGYTAAQLAGEFSHATNGYHKLPGGTIVQWGTGSTTTNWNTKTSFPVAFPSAVSSIVVTPKRPNGTPSSDVYYPRTGVKAYDLAGFYGGAESGDTNDFFWLAIGY